MERFGPNNLSVGLINNQLALWSFYAGVRGQCVAPALIRRCKPVLPDGRSLSSSHAVRSPPQDYADALDAAEAGHNIWVSADQVLIASESPALVHSTHPRAARCLQVHAEGEDSGAAKFHGIRLGMVLAGGAAWWCWASSTDARCTPLDTQRFYKCWFLTEGPSLFLPLLTRSQRQA